MESIVGIISSQRSKNKLNRLFSQSQHIGNGRNVKHSNLLATGVLNQLLTDALVEFGASKLRMPTL